MSGNQQKDPTSPAVSKVRSAYAVTHWWLDKNPEYQRLKAASELEGTTNPRVWVDRNRFALYVEANTPFPGPNL
jgi:hypothetical protein